MLHSLHGFVIVALAVVTLMQVGYASGGQVDNRKYGSILNNDGNNILYGITPEGATPEAYRKGVEHLLDARPGILAQDIGQPDPVFYLSDVASPWFRHLGKGSDSKAMKALADAGTDPLALTVEVCRKRGVPIVASFRMNAEDLGHSKFDSSDFGRANKHLRIEGRNCLDPAHPKVYEHRMKIFAEVIEKYDLDGLEFDYKRWHHMISNPRENHVILTRMLRETRQMLDEVAKRKGRGRMILGVRVEPMISGDLNLADFPGAIPPPFNRSCEASGLDIKTWIDEELIDYVCPSLFWPKWPGLPHIAEFVDLAKGRNVGIYPTVFPKPEWLSKDDPPIEPDDDERMRRYKNELCDLALRCYAEGADGISTFNWTPHHQGGIFTKPIRHEWGDGNKALQMHIHGLLADAAALEAYRRSPLLLPAGVRAFSIPTKRPELPAAATGFVVLSRRTSGHSASHPPVRRDLPEGRANMTGGVNTQHDPRVRAGAMGVDRQPSNRPIGHADRRLDTRAGGIQAVVAAERLGFLGGDILLPKEPGSIAGSSSTGKCQV